MITVAMATYDDFDGVYFTVQAMRMHSGVDTAFIVVDNNPHGQHAQSTRKFLLSVPKARYVPMAKPVGTGPSRDRAIAESETEWVLVVDPHVLVQGLAQTVEWLGREGGDHLYSGVLLYDDLKNRSTHFDDVWGDDQMWGKWGTDHTALEKGVPFDVPAMGLGLFLTRRASWLGFNPEFRGFGGEEWYIHEKYRRAGRRCVCLPWLEWVHRFGRPNGVPYPLKLEDKARNYVIGLTELGIPLDRARESFAPKLAIDKLPAREEPKIRTLEELFTAVKSTPRDLDQHADYVRGLAGGQHVRAMVKRVEWEVILAAGGPKSLTVYQMENGPLSDEISLEYESVVGVRPMQAPARECDLLVLDSDHKSDLLWEELSRHAPLAKRVLLRGTSAFAEQDEGGGGKGLLSAVRRWIKEHPEWTVVEHRSAQYGMTLLSRREEDKRELPSLWQQGVNAAKASWRAGQNVLAGFGPIKDTEEHDRRLSLCLICDQHSNGRCSACGCPIDRKTSYPTEKCPLGKWGVV